MLGNADGALLRLVEAEAGYRGTPHQHDHAEFLSAVDGTLRTQTRTLGAGDGDAAAAGSTHDDFDAATAATYVIVFRTSAFPPRMLVTPGGPGVTDPTIDRSPVSGSARAAG